jgi:hypothetical protein
MMNRGVLNFASTGLARPVMATFVAARLWRGKFDSGGFFRGH